MQGPRPAEGPFRDLPLVASSRIKTNQFYQRCERAAFRTLLKLDRGVYSTFWSLQQRSSNSNPNQNSLRNLDIAGDSCLKHRPYLCFCPPESCDPLFPTWVSYPSGKDMMKSWAFACIAALTIISCVAPLFPNEMFFAMVPFRRFGS